MNKVAALLTLAAMLMNQVLGQECMNSVEFAVIKPKYQMNTGGADDGHLFQIYKKMQGEQAGYEEQDEVAPQPEEPETDEIVPEETDELAELEQELADEEAQIGQTEEQPEEEQHEEDTTSEQDSDFDSDSDQTSPPTDADTQTEEQGFQGHEEDTELEVHQEELPEEEETQEPERDDQGAADEPAVDPSEPMQDDEQVEPDQVDPQMIDLPDESNMGDEQTNEEDLTDEQEPPPQEGAAGEGDEQVADDLGTEEDAEEEDRSASDTEENDELETLEGEVLEPSGGEQDVQEPPFQPGEEPTEDPEDGSRNESAEQVNGEDQTAEQNAEDPVAEETLEDSPDQEHEQPDGDSEANGGDDAASANEPQDADQGAGVAEAAEEDQENREDEPEQMAEAENQAEGDEGEEQDASNESTNGDRQAEQTIEDSLADEETTEEGSHDPNQSANVVDEGGNDDEEAEEGSGESNIVAENEETGNEAVDTSTQDETNGNESSNSRRRLTEQKDSEVLDERSEKHDAKSKIERSDREIDKYSGEAHLTWTEVDNVEPADGKSEAGTGDQKTAAGDPRSEVDKAEAGVAQDQELEFREQSEWKKVEDKGKQVYGHQKPGANAEGKNSEDDEEEEERDGNTGAEEEAESMKQPDEKGWIGESGLENGQGHRVDQASTTDQYEDCENKIDDEERDDAREKAEEEKKTEHQLFRTTRRQRHLQDGQEAAHEEKKDVEQDQHELGEESGHERNERPKVGMNKKPSEYPNEANNQGRPSEQKVSNELKQGPRQLQEGQLRQEPTEEQGEVLDEEAEEDQSNQESPTQEELLVEQETGEVPAAQPAEESPAEELSPEAEPSQETENQELLTEEQQEAEEQEQAEQQAAEEDYGFVFTFTIDGSGNQNQNYDWTLECILNFQPLIKTRETEDGWNSGSFFDASNQIQLTFKPDAAYPSQFLAASLVVTAITPVQSANPMRRGEDSLEKQDIFKIENYRDRELKIVIALEEVAGGDFVLRVREGAQADIRYDTATDGWTEEEMEIFAILRRETNARALDDLQYVPQFRVYSANIGDLQKIKVDKQNIAAWQMTYSDSFRVDQAEDSKDLEILMSANIMNAISPSIRDQTNSNFRVERLPAGSNDQEVGIRADLRGPITSHVYSALQTEQPLSFKMPNAVAGAAFRLLVRPRLQMSGSTTNLIELPIKVYLQKSNFPFTQLSPRYTLVANDSLHDIEINSLIGGDRYGSMEKPELALIFDFGATEEQANMINEQIKSEAAASGVNEDSVEWSIELSEMALFRKYDAGEYPHRSCLRSLLTSRMEVIEDFEELDFGNNESYITLNRLLLTTSMVLFIISAGVISVSIILSFRNRKSLYNMVVLKESNQKLDGLLYLLAYSLEQLMNPDHDTPMRRGLDQAHNQKTLDGDAVSVQAIAVEVVDGDRGGNGRLAADRSRVSLQSIRSHQSKMSMKSKISRKSNKSRKSHHQRMTIMSFGGGDKNYRQLPEAEGNYQAVHHGGDSQLLKGHIEMRRMKVGAGAREPAGWTGHNGDQTAQVDPARKGDEQFIDISFDKLGAKSVTHQAKTRGARENIMRNHGQGEEAASAVGVDTESGSDSDHSEGAEILSDENDELGQDEYDEEEGFQREVNEIINSVMHLDLGDAKSNKAMQEQMNRYKEENKLLTDQLSQRSKKSFKSNFSRKTNKYSQKGGPSGARGPLGRHAGRQASMMARNLDPGLLGRPAKGRQPPVGKDAAENSRNQQALNMPGATHAGAVNSKNPRALAQLSDQKSQKELNLSEANEFINS